MSIEGTISAYEISAEHFFETLKARKVDLLLDVRLKNRNQLCGFTKHSDLGYLARAICGADYIHELVFAPPPELLERYLGRWIDWPQYAAQYQDHLRRVDAKHRFQKQYGQYKKICLLGTATKKRRSHTEVLEQFLKGDV